MDQVLILIAVVIVSVFIKSIPHVKHYIEKRRERKMIGNDSGPDPDFYPLTYSPHYSRALEADAGMKVETRCDNNTCKVCYWKPRAYKKHNQLPTTGLKQRFDKWVEEDLPDGLSDELYESMFEDWLAQPSIASQIEYHRKLEVERDHSASLHYINKYKTEGAPKPPKQSKGGPTGQHVINDYNNLMTKDASRNALESASEFASDLRALIRQSINNNDVDAVADYNRDLEDVTKRITDLKSDMFYER